MMNKKEEESVGRSGRRQCRRHRRRRHLQLYSKVVSIATIIIIVVLVVVCVQAKSASATAFADGSSTNRNNRKQLILLAGPHQSGSVGTYQFLDQYATNYDSNDDGNDNTNDNDNNQSKITGWNWPTVVVDMESYVGNRYEIFDRLVTDDSNSNSNGPTITTTTLLQSIRDAWKNSLYGIIIGSDDFDRASLSSSSSETANDDNNDNIKNSALSVVIRLKENLSIPSHDDVTIVLFYQRDRVDQLSKLWTEEYIGSTTTTTATYKDYICAVQDRQSASSKHQDDQTWNFLDTSMNPFRIAVEYRRAGFKVMVVDVQHVVDTSNKDVSHAIVCALGGVTCINDNKWIATLPNARTPSSSVGTTNDSKKELSKELDDQQIDDLNTMLRHRDCYWKDTLVSDPKFSVLDGNGRFSGGPNEGGGGVSNLFDGCGDDARSEFKFSHTQFLVFGLKQQLDCEDQSSDPENNPDYLDTPPATTVQSTGESSESNNNTAAKALFGIVGVVLLIPCYIFCCMQYRKNCCNCKSPRTLDESDGVFKDDDDDVIKLPRNPFSDDIPNLPFRQSSSPTKDVDTTEEANSSDDDDEEKGTRGAWAMNPKSIMTGVIRGNNKGGLCRACKMVGVDPNCAFCDGGRTTSKSKSKKIQSSLVANDLDTIAEVSDYTNDETNIADGDVMHMCTYCTSGFGAPNPECATCNMGTADLNERWQGQFLHRTDASTPFDGDEQEDTDIDPLGFMDVSLSGINDDTDAPRITNSTITFNAEPSKSRMMNKLKELRDLKGSELL